MGWQSRPRASTAPNHKGVDSGRDAGQRRSRDQGSPADQGGRGLGGRSRAGPGPAGRRRQRPVLPARLLPPGGHRGPALALAAGGGGAGPRRARPAPAAGPGPDPGPCARARAPGPGHPGQPDRRHRHRRHALPGRLGHHPAEPAQGRDLPARAPVAAGPPGRDRRAARNRRGVQRGRGPGQAGRRRRRHRRADRIVDPRRARAARGRGHGRGAGVGPAPRARGRAGGRRRLPADGGRRPQAGRRPGRGAQ